MCIADRSRRKAVWAKPGAEQQLREVGVNHPPLLWRGPVRSHLTVGWILILPGGGAPRGGLAVLRRVPPLMGRRRGQGVITGLAAKRPAVLLKRAGALNKSTASQVPAGQRGETAFWIDCCWSVSRGLYGRKGQSPVKRRGCFTTLVISEYSELFLYEHIKTAEVEALTVGNMRGHVCLLHGHGAESSVKKVFKTSNVAYGAPCCVNLKRMFIEVHTVWMIHLKATESSKEKLLLSAYSLIEEYLNIMLDISGLWLSHAR